MRPRTAIIGGGLAGREAAVQLLARGTGDVLVLEARDQASPRPDATSSP